MSEESRSDYNSDFEPKRQKITNIIENIDAKIHRIEDMEYPQDRYGQRNFSNREWQMQQTNPEDTDLNDAMIFLNRIKDEYIENQSIYDNFLETMRDFKFEKIDAEEVCKAIRILFKDKPYLVKHFDEYLPHHLRFVESIRNYDERNKFATNFRNPFQGLTSNQIQASRSQSYSSKQRHSPPSEQAIRAKPEQNADMDSPKHKGAKDFLYLVRKRYSNKPFIYKQFVELLQNKKSGVEKLFSQVSALLHDTPDLIEKFEKDFKSACTEIPFSDETDPLNKIKQVLAEKGVLDPFLKVVNFYNQNYISAAHMIGILSPILESDENLAALKSFINYEDYVVDTEQKYAHLKKIGSYKLLENKITVKNDVLNDCCVCVPTFESEEDVYTFRNKNYSEELLSRIFDEKADSDLLLDRIKYLIIRLEDVYNCLEDGEIDLGSIQMSSSLIKETLKNIYENKSTEILEAILTNPQKSIPVILRRLNAVYKENSWKIRDFKKYWRSVVDEHYYKAYDSKGMNYRNHEKNKLSLKYILSEPALEPAIFSIDEEVISIVVELYGIFANSQSRDDQRVGQKIEALNRIFENLKLDDFNLKVEFGTYSLYYFIVMLYTRLLEMKSYKFGPYCSNPIAVDINLQSEFNVVNRFDDVISSAKKLMDKTIEVDDFEEHTRRLFKGVGFKLYNIKKIMFKLDKQLGYLIDENHPENDLNISYEITKKANEIKLSSFITDAQ